LAQIWIMPEKWTFIADIKFTTVFRSFQQKNYFFVNAAVLPGKRHCFSDKSDFMNLSFSRS